MVLTGASYMVVEILLDRSWSFQMLEEVKKKSLGELVEQRRL